MLPAVCLAVCLSLGDGAAASQIEMQVCGWQFRGSDQGWVPLHSIALQAEPDALVLTSTGPDPYAAGPVATFVTTEYQYLRIRAASNVSGEAQVFWAAGDTPDQAQFRAEDAVSFQVSGDGRMHTYTVLLPWRPGVKVHRIRLDLPDTPGARLRLAELSVLQRLPRGGAGDRLEFSFESPGDAGFWVPMSDVERCEVKNGALAVTASGSQPLVLGPRFERTSDEVRYLSIGVAVRGARYLQVRYRGETDAIPPCNRLDFPVINDGRFHTYNIPLFEARGYPEKVTRIAVGLSEAQAGSVFLVKWLRLGTAPYGPPEPVLESLSCGGTVVPTGRPVVVKAVVRNLGGRPTPPIRVSLRMGEGYRIVGPRTANIGQVGPAGSAESTWHVVFEQPRSYNSVTLTAVLSAGSNSSSASTDVVPSRWYDSVRRPGDVVVGEGNVRLVIPRNRYGYGPGFLLARRTEGWRLVGTLPCLGMVSVQRGGAREDRKIWSARMAEVKSRADGVELVSLTSSWQDGGGRRWRYSLMMRPKGSWVECEAQLACSQPADLLSFSAPELLAGDASFGGKRDLGLFPGLEYLLPGERSSGTDFAAPPVNNRLAPHPNRVTVPLMAVLCGGSMAGVMWDPLQRWDGEHDRPVARFASPNFVSGAPNHLMSLAIPGAGPSFAENSFEPKRPYKVQPGRPLTLSWDLFAGSGSDVGDVMRVWLARRGGFPPPPSPPYDLAVQSAAVLHEYTETAWVPGQAKWHRAIADPWGPDYLETHVLHLQWELERGLSGSLAEKARQVLDSAVRARQESGGGLGLQVAFHRGGADAVSRGLWAEAAGLARSIRADGSVSFEPDASHAVFGKRGDSSSGHTAAVAWRLWQLALITGSQEAAEAGLRAIAYLDGQKRPEGAQTWELPLHVPDVLAAAHAVRCCVAAYRFTGDKRYLDRAVTWAYRGLPFIYLWAARDRPIMLYGSIPVFGATWYTGGWFGRIVQWNGLEFADALFELAQHDRSQPWLGIAQGILNCAFRQQRPTDRRLHPFAAAIPDCGHAGMYPDSYDPVSGTDSYHWCLSSESLLGLAYKLAGIDPAPKTTIVRSSEGKRAHLTSVAYVQQAHLGPTRFEAGIRFPAGLSHHIMLVLPFEPTQVLYDGRQLQRAQALDSEAIGWKWDAERSCLHIRVRQEAGTSRLVVESG